MNCLKAAIPIANLPVVAMLLTNACSAGLLATTAPIQSYITQATRHHQRRLYEALKSRRTVTDRIPLQLMRIRKLSKNLVSSVRLPFSSLMDFLVSSPRLHQHNKNPSLTCFNQSYQTTPTVIIPGGYQCKSKRRRRHVSAPTDSVFTS